MSFKKVKQQRRVVLLALYLLKKRFGKHHPLKRHVLRFIQTQHLMHVPATDQDMRTTGDAVWENDLAWKREDLKELGLLRMPRHGVWEITEEGEKDVEAWAQRMKGVVEKRPDWQKDFRANAEAELNDEAHYEFYITEETVQWGLKIAANALR